MTERSAYSGVALSGRAGAGKSTVAALLAPALGLQVGSFAAALKRDLASLGCHKGDPGFREVAIAYGTTHKRAMDADYWLRRLRDENGGSLAGLVLDDMRMTNEADAAEADGLLLVRLDVPPWVRAERLGLAADDPFVRSDHESEAALDSRRFPLFIPHGLTPEDIAMTIATFYQRGRS